MSKQTITDKANVIRRETQQFANTRGRVADVIDDINETKADKVDLDAAVNGSLEPLKQRITAVEQKNNQQDIAIQNEASARAGADNSLQTQINAEIIARQNADNLKVDKPTSDGNWVLSKLGNVFTWVNANEFGKNVANAFLDTVANAGVNMKAIWKIATNGFPLHITGLADKSNDATYNNLLVEDSNGVVGTTNGKQVMLNMPSALTEAEKTDWKTAMNGGWTTGTMSVFLINPVSIDKMINVSQYITLIGANLNMNPTNFSVEIMDEAGTTLIATVPNSQVQLQTNGISLIFYYNFSTIPLGTYKIRLNNGAATYVTGVTFNVLNGVNNYDLSALTWTMKTYNDATNSSYSIGSLSVSTKALLDGINTNTLPNGTSVVTITSSEIGTMNDDFVIEYAMWWDEANSQSFYAGACNDISANLNNTVLFGMSQNTGSYNNLTGAGVNGVFNSSNRGIIYKKGNSLTNIVFNNSGSVSGITTVQVDNKPIKMKLHRTSDSEPIRNNLSCTLVIIKAYKTN